MPKLDMSLPSGNLLVDTCGSLSYDVSHMPVSPSVWYMLDPPDIQGNPIIRVFSNDQYLVSNLESEKYSKTYTLNIKATLEEFDLSTNYWI